MNVSITVPPHTTEIYKVDLQALVAQYLRQHGVTTPCVTVAEAPGNADDYLGKNPVFMHEATVYDTPRAPTAQILATADLQMSLMPEEVLAGTPISAEPSETSLVKQAQREALPPG